MTRHIASCFAHEKPSHNTLRQTRRLKPTSTRSRVVLGEKISQLSRVVDRSSLCRRLFISPPSHSDPNQFRERHSPLALRFTRTRPTRIDPCVFDCPTERVDLGMLVLASTFQQIGRGGELYLAAMAHTPGQFRTFRGRIRFLSGIELGSSHNH